MEIDAASRAAAVGLDRKGKEVAAPRAPEHFVRPHQVRRPRAGGVLQRPARCAFLWRRFCASLSVPRLSRLVLIAALLVLAIAHEIIGQERQDGLDGPEGQNNPFLVLPFLPIPPFLPTLSPTLFHRLRHNERRRFHHLIDSRDLLGLNPREPADGRVEFLLQLLHA